MAKDLGISESCLRGWMVQADVDESGSSTRLTSAWKKELAELRRMNQQFGMEDEILKRAAAYFAREKRSPTVIFPLVRELAADGLDVAVACGILQASRPGYDE